MYRDYFTIQAEAEEQVKLSIEDYDDKAKVWQRIFFNSLPMRKELPRVGNLVKVLDLGCNTGYNTVLLHERYGYAEGIDINPELIRASKVNTYNCKLGDITDLPYDDEEFSLIVAKDVLEHSNHPERAIREAYRVLAFGGNFVCMLPLDGEVMKIDDVVTSPIFNFNNRSHYWKATLMGAVYRLFNVGFTELKCTLYNHKDIFGVEREFGNRVAVISAWKRRDIIKLPFKWLWGNSYWATFITFRCNGRCKYCIQTMAPAEFRKARREYSKMELDSEIFISTINRFQRYADSRYSIIGGEPTLRDDFLYIINNLDGYNVTATTNLTTPIFEDTDLFARSIKNPHRFRLNTSFHPGLIEPRDFCMRVKGLRDSGIYVDQVAMVDCPGSNFRYYYNEFIKHGIVLSPQTFLGKIGDLLYPNDQSYGLTNDVREHGINDSDLYEAGFSYRNKSSIFCNSKRFLIAPDGGVYDCHYKIYSRREPLFNITWLSENGDTGVDLDDYIKCDHFGFCNPCDYPHVKFKALAIEDKIAEISVQRKFSPLFSLAEQVSQDDEKFHELVKLITKELYCNENLYWQLYNNRKIKDAINAYINIGDFIDNRNAYKLAKFDVLLHKALGGLNVYRILGERARIAYIEALAVLVSDYILQEVILPLVRDIDLGKALNFRAELGKLYNTFATLHEAKKLMIIRKKE